MSFQGCLGSLLKCSKNPGPLAYVMVDQGVFPGTPQYLLLDFLPSEYPSLYTKPILSKLEILVHNL